MPNIDLVTASIEIFLNQSIKKILLIKGDMSADEYTLVLQRVTLNHKVAPIDLIHPEDARKLIDSIPESDTTILIFKGLDKNIALTNFYLAFNLARHGGKTIFIFDRSLLHPTLDPSIYFAPMEGNRIKRSLLSVHSFTTQAFHQNQTFVMTQSKDRPSHNPLENQFLNEQIMALDTLMMQMLADRMHDERFKTFLFQLVFASRGNKQSQIAAANAITVLNLAKVNFSGMDLSHIKVCGANLSGGNFQRTCFDNADLSRVIFRQAILLEASMREAILNEVDFGEVPSFNQKSSNGIVNDIAPYQNSFIVTTVSDSNKNDISVIVGDIISRKTILKISLGIFDVHGTDLSDNGSFLFIHGLNTKEQLYSLVYRVADGKKLWSAPIDMSFLTFSPKSYAFAYEIELSGSEPGLHILSFADANVRTMYLQVQRNRNIGGPTKYFTYSPDGEYFAFIAEQGICIWEANNHAKGYNLITQSDFIPHLLDPEKVRDEYDDMPQVLIFKPNSAILVTGHFPEILIWHHPKKHFITRLLGHTAFIHSMAFSNDGRILATGGDDSTIRLWDAENWTSLNVVIDKNNWINKLLFHPTQPWLACNCDGNISFFDISKQTHPLENIGHVHVVHHVTCNAQKALLATCSLDYTVRIWDANKRTLLRTLRYKFDGSPKKMQFTQNHQLLILCDGGRRDGLLYSYNVQESKLEELKIPSGKTIINNIGTLLAIYNEHSRVPQERNAFIIWDIWNKREITKWFEEEQDTKDGAELYIFNFTPDNKYIFLGYNNGTVSCVKIEDLSYFLFNFEELNLKFPKSKISDIQFDKYGRSIIVNDKGEVIILGKQRIAFQAYEKSIDAIIILTPSRALIAYNGILSIWDLSDCTCAYKITAHKGDISSMCLVQSNVLATVSSDYALSFWQIDISPNSYSIRLLSTTRPLLNTDKCDITHAQKLSPLAKRLLLQLGAHEDNPEPKATSPAKQKKNKKKKSLLIAAHSFFTDTNPLNPNATNSARNAPAPNPSVKK